MLHINQILWWSFLWLLHVSSCYALQAVDMVGCSSQRLWAHFSSSVQGHARLAVTLVWWGGWRGRFTFHLRCTLWSSLIACVHTHIHTFTLHYIHTYMHTYIHTYTYIHSCRPSSYSWSSSSCLGRGNCAPPHPSSTPTSCQPNDPSGQTAVHWEHPLWNLGGSDDRCFQWKDGQLRVDLSSWKSCLGCAD